MLQGVLSVVKYLQRPKQNDEIAVLDFQLYVHLMNIQKI